ncbi:MAG: phosphate ABC transporter permease component [Candidatus Scalindua rubra]|uniref:Phosphate transport system permease protein PstA n=1 Tax=Candidatus Scalindua rubra TaxID=1872076 RepID=A0A1E3X8R4_9BACT|nr:MAG: phosphate ABC transporter permease component [Candidatus Scalindua rubra]
MNRKLSNSALLIICHLAAVISILTLVFLLSVIVFNGIRAINLEFILTRSRNFGAEGGIFYQIIGSILLVFCTALISFPLALGTAIFKSECLKNFYLLKLSSILIYGLNGIPSIIFGIFGLVFFVHYLNTGISWFVGSIILAIMIMPTIVLAAYQSINSIPKIYRESAQALGLSKWRVILQVIIPQGIGGAITGLLIGLARAIGETAPIMFIATAFSGVEIPGSLLEPVTALPTHILILSQQATNPLALQNAWGCSLILITIVFIFSISALFSRISLRPVSQR